MKKTINLLSLFMIFVTVACKKDITEVNQNPAELISTERSGPATVSLSVGIRNETTDKILSDGLGLYLNGKDRVEASILSSDGNFYMNTNNNTARSPVRNIEVVLNNPPVQMGDQRNYSFRTVAPTDATVNGGTTYWMQNIPVNTSQLMGFRVWGFQQGGYISWKLHYRNGVDNTAQSNTDYVKVTRVSLTEWWIEPASFPGVNPASANLRDGNANLLGSGYIVPFKFVLKKL